ncbi:hypothetical protein ASF72_10660 [Arthrobacter sp. Leaf141]|uniref:hypothetical protein n=1 Tax=Arthrobacter sp. Leaf141 TaxID=1736273 RepID=UPI0006F2FE13|nr:hypothetical protein [Arthrobacter sp. Leaf141]KQR02487.1 hypothetical protein ASF72_10660 [Arthrobacter sp. Leaf141]
MSPRVVGPSGVPLDVSTDMARSLVRDGYAFLAAGEPETALVTPDPAIVILNPEVAPGLVLPVGNSVADLTAQPTADGRPRGNASREEWVAYALANGKTEDDLTGLKQGEIRELFAERPQEAPSEDADLDSSVLQVIPAGKDGAETGPSPLDVPPHPEAATADAETTAPEK